MHDDLPEISNINTLPEGLWHLFPIFFTDTMMHPIAFGYIPRRYCELVIVVLRHHRMHKKLHSSSIRVNPALLNQHIFPIKTAVLEVYQVSRHIHQPINLRLVLSSQVPHLPVVHVEKELIRKPIINRSESISLYKLSMTTVYGIALYPSLPFHVVSRLVCPISI